MPADDGYLDLDAAARFVGVTPGELDKLTRAGAVQRENGRFHPLRLVRGYVEHIRTEGERLESIRYEATPNGLGHVSATEFGDAHRISLSHPHPSGDRQSSGVTKTAKSKATYSHHISA